MPRGGVAVDPLGCVDQAAHARQSCGIKHMRDFHHHAAVSTPCNNAAIPRSRSAFMGEPRNQCSALSMNAGVPVSRTRASHASAVSTRTEEHTSELQSLMRISYAVFCLKKKTQKQ